jgi:class 3 adenylate cyclase
MSSSTTAAAKASFPLIVLRDRLAHLVGKRKRFLGALLCGLVMGWAVLSACTFRTPLSSWSWMLALCVLGLSLIHLRMGAVLTGLVCTVQMFSVHGQLGFLTAFLSFLFVLFCERHAGASCALLAAPYLMQFDLGIAVPLGLAMAAGRRAAWFWAALAFLFCAAHGIAVGQPRLGLVPFPRFVAAEKAIGAKGITPFDGGWITRGLGQADLAELREDVLQYVINPKTMVPLVAQLLAWCLVTSLARALYLRRDLKDRLALEYLARATRRTQRTPLHRQLHGALVVGALGFVVAYIVMAALSPSVQYGALKAVMDVLAVALLWVPLWVRLEGDPRVVQEAKAEQSGGPSVALKDLPVGDGGGRRLPHTRPAVDSQGGTQAPGFAGVAPTARPASASGMPAPRARVPAPRPQGSEASAGATWSPPARAATPAPTHSGRNKGNENGAATSAVEAIMFIDMVGSTALGSKYGDDYVLGLKEQLGGIVRSESQRHRVLFSKGTGDGFMLTFPEAENAVTTALNILRNVRTANEKLSEARSIHLRMGIHLGQINIDSQGDRIGTAANFAARIEAAKLDQLKGAEDLASVQLPERDRVLILEVVNDEIKGNPAFSVRSIGYFEFKGITGLHRIFEVAAPEASP